MLLVGPNALGSNKVVAIDAIQLISDVVLHGAGIAGEFACASAACRTPSHAACMIAVSAHPASP